MDYYDKTEYGYGQGYLQGTLQSRVEIIINILTDEEDNDDERNMPGRDIIKKLMPMRDIDEYINEIISIISKYPAYSTEHKARKVIFESTFLPYTDSDTSEI